MIHAVREEDWLADNQRSLTRAIEEVRGALAGVTYERNAWMGGSEPEGQAQTSMEDDALERLCSAFELTRFERSLLVWCAAVELDSSMARECAELRGEHSPHPNFSLALAALPEPHWSAILPESPLRRWRLIEVLPGALLTTSPLRIDERVLHYLTGSGTLDDRLSAMLTSLRQGVLTESQLRAAPEIVAHCERGEMICLHGEDAEGKRAVACFACEAMDQQPWLLYAELIPPAATELQNFLLLWTREALLQPRALVIDADDVDWREASKSGLPRLLSRYRGTVFLLTRQRQAVRGRPSFAVEIGKPTLEEQRHIWEDALTTAGQTLDGQLARVIGQFNLGADVIQSIASSLDDPGSTGFPPTLWDACRRQARPRMDGLAERVETNCGWDDLVLPAPQKATLREVASQVRQRSRVYLDWGFGGRETRGLGVSALFAGPSGTGKTMAAEVLASALHLDLYKIDLSQVISKYIGDTERSLRRVFDAAETGGAILFFDEADALFGKRTEVKDSHDRYANIEVSYLLQRMEAYRGLAILTTNMRGALDAAFLRRIRFVIQFPFPEAAQRAEIWRRAFPADTPTEELDIQKLARLNVPGGSIRNVALNGAFLAADAGEPVRMSHLAQAARSECAKLDRVLTEAEIGGWI